MEDEKQLDKPATITVIISDFTLLERLNTISKEYDKDWDILINMAIRRFVDDVEEVRGLRLK
jgi:hypothetical protein